MNVSFVVIWTSDTKKVDSLGEERVEVKSAMSTDRIMILVVEGGVLKLKDKKWKDVEKWRNGMLMLRMVQALWLVVVKTGKTRVVLKLRINSSADVHQMMRVIRQGW
jgi:hypothetical protein